MAKPRYGWAHQKERDAWRPIVLAGEAYCAEPICLMSSRWIPPWTPSRLWHISHDPTGTIVIGPSHRRCNLAEAAKRGNRMRTRQKPHRDPTEGRWEL